MDNLNEIYDRVSLYIANAVMDYFDNLIAETGSGTFPKGERMVITLPRELAETWLRLENKPWDELTVLQNLSDGWQAVWVERDPFPNGQEYVVVFQAKS